MALHVMPPTVAAASTKHHSKCMFSTRPTGSTHRPGKPATQNQRHSRGLPCPHDHQHVFSVECMPALGSMQAQNTTVKLVPPGSLRDGLLLHAAKAQQQRLVRRVLGKAISKHFDCWCRRWCDPAEISTGSTALHSSYQPTPANSQACTRPQ